MRLFAVATDMKGQVTTSASVTIRIIGDEQAKQEVMKELAALAARLRQALAWQKNVRSQTVDNKAKLDALAGEQAGINTLLTEILGEAGPIRKRAILGVRQRFENVVRG